MRILFKYIAFTSLSFKSEQYGSDTFIKRQHMSQDDLFWAKMPGQLITLECIWKILTLALAKKDVHIKFNLGLLAVLFIYKTQLRKKHQLRLYFKHVLTKIEIFYPMFFSRNIVDIDQAKIS